MGIASILIAKLHGPCVDHPGPGPAVISFSSIGARALCSVQAASRSARARLVEHVLQLGLALFAAGCCLIAGERNFLPGLIAIKTGRPIAGGTSRCVRAVATPLSPPPLGRRATSLSSCSVPRPASVLMRKRKAT